MHGNNNGRLNGKHPAPHVEGWQDMRSDYRMAATGPQRKERANVPHSGASADWHARSESQYYRMVERSRDIRINDPLVGKGLQRLASNVIQDGFMPDLNSGDPNADQLAKDLWFKWSQDCELQGEFTFNALERLAFTSVVGDGDMLILPTDSGKLQAIESHLMRTPNEKPKDNTIVLGVELNSFRQRIAYHLVNDETEPVRSRVGFSGQTRRYAAKDKDGRAQAFHVYFPDRITQTRGIPCVQAVDDFINYHDDIQFAQLVKQQVSCNYAIFVERDIGVPGIPAIGTDGVTDETFSDGSIRTTDEIYPGKKYYGEAGERLHGFSPNVPNQEYFEHVMMMLQIIAVNLDLPVQVLLMDPRQTNFSGWRGSLDQAKSRWRDLQRCFRDKFHAKVWQWKMRQWIRENRILSRAAMNGADLNAVTWRLPAWPYIEPMKDAEADAYQIDHRLNSPRRVLSQRGLEYDQVLDEIIKDNTNAVIKAKAAAAEVNAQFPDHAPVHWQDILSIPSQQGLSQSISHQDVLDESTSNQ